MFFTLSSWEMNKQNASTMCDYLSELVTECEERMRNI